MKTSVLLFLTLASATYATQSGSSLAASNLARLKFFRLPANLRASYLQSAFSSFCAVPNSTFTVIADGNTLGACWE